MKASRYFLTCLLWLVLAASVSAQTLIKDTDWTTGNFGSSTYGAAGSTTGAGDGWIDVAGNTAHVVSNKLVLSGDLMRPASETTAVRDQKQVGLIIANINGGTEGFVKTRIAYSPNYGYQAEIYNGYILKVSAINSSYATANIACSPVPTTGDTLRLELSASGANPTTLTANVYNVTTGGGLIGTSTGTDSAGQQVAGQMGLGAIGSVQFLRAQTYNLAGLPVTLAAAPTGASIGLTTTLSYGTAPYTVKIYRSTTYGFTPGVGNLVNTAATSGSATTSTYTDATATAGQVYYYVAAATDSAGTPVTNTSAQITAALTGATINITGIGDSIMLGNVSGGGPTPFISMQTRLAIGLNCAVNYTNKAVSGTDSTDWQPGASNGYLASALSSITTGTYVPIMLGTNDVWGSKATTAATYQSNMQAICSAVVSAGGIPVLMTPPYPTPGSNSNQWDGNSPGRLQAMIATLDTIANGTTILRGDKQMFVYTANHPEQKTDGIHLNGPASPNPGTGSAVGGELWADGLAQSISAKLAGGGTGASRGPGGFGFSFWTAGGWKTAPILTSRRAKKTLVHR